jgi:RHS repeat-associated protein
MGHKVWCVGFIGFLRLVAALQYKSSGRCVMSLALISALALLPLLLWAVPLGAQETIDPRSGRLVLSATDLVLPAGPVTLEVQRSLGAMPNKRGFLGKRWRLNWESRLVRAGRRVLLDEAGVTVPFEADKSKGGYKTGAGERLVFDKQQQALRTRLDGTQERFDAQGRLVARDYRNGNTVALHYDAAGRLAQINGPKGSFLRLTADPEGRVMRVDASTGAMVQYTYVGEALTAVQVNGGPALRYAYDTKGALSRIEDPYSGAVEFAYDAKGRVVSRRWADGSQERFEYDAATNRQRRIDAAGGSTTIQWSPDGRQVEITDPLGQKSVIVYDAARRPLAVTGPTGATARFTYDALGRTVAMEAPLGQVTRLEYVGESAQVQAVLRPNSPRQLLEYDPHGNLTAVKLGETTVAALAYHPDGSVATTRGYGVPEQRFTYHVDGRLKSVASALGETTHFEYDPRGNLLRETNPLGGVTLRSYDAQDRLVSLTDPAGAVSRYEYDAQGRLSRSIDPSGGVTRYEYDARGRLLAETDPADQTARYEYDAVGRLLKVTAPGPVSEHWRYDAAGRLQEWTDHLGRTTQFDHDPLGRVTAERGVTGLEVRYRYDALGNLLGLEDSTGAKRELQYDATGQLIATIDPLTATAQYLYDALGNLISLIDPRGQLKDFTYSAEGLLASVREPSGDEGRYEYDAAGRLVAMQRPSGGVTRFSYDALGNVTAEVDPLGNQWRHTYDTAGRLVSTTDAAGRATRYTYDPSGRLLEKLLADGKQVTYQYDRLGNLISADDGAFPIRQSYDQAGRLVRVEYPAIKKAVGYEYDSAGLRTKLIDPVGRTMRYGYTPQKSLAAIILPDGKRISVTYDEKDRLQSMRYPNGIAGRWEYDADDRVSKITYADKGGNIVGGWTYGYDAAGNLVEQEDHQRQFRRFQYDQAGQLTEAAGLDGAIRYRYGPGGSRATVEAGGTLMQYRHDAADRVIQAGQEQLTHDANGNLITRHTPHGTTGYEFDAEGRLTRIVGPSESIAFGYAPTGERVWRRDRDGLTYFVYDGLDLIEELSEAGTSKTTYVHGPGIDEPLAMLRDGRTYYYHADRLGNIRLLTDDQGQVAATYDYDAFGNLSTSQGSVPNPFTFTGREWDASTGLYYYRARYYDPGLGQFLSPDPLPATLDEPLEQNPYLYVRNQPLRFVDPLGLAGDRPYKDLSLDELIKRKQDLKAKYWRTLHARMRVTELNQEIYVRSEYTPHERARLNKLYAMGQRLDNAISDVKGELARRTGHTYRPPSAQSFAPPPPSLLTRLRQGVEQFFGGGGAPPSPPASGEAPSSPSASGGRQNTRVTPGQNIRRGGNTKVVGRGGAAIIGAGILLGASNTAQASPQDRPRVAIQETTDLASSLASHIAKSWACAKIGGCIAGQPGAAVGAATPTVVSVIETVVGVGQTLVNIVDQLATSDNLPPPPQLLPPPRLEGPTGPPPELPPRPAEDPTSILTPVLPPPTPDQIGAADRQAAPFGAGMPGAREPRERGGQAVGQQGTAYQSPGSAPPGQSGQAVPLPPGTYNPYGEGPGRFPFPPRGPSSDEPSVRVPHDTLQPSPGMGNKPVGKPDKPMGPKPSPGMGNKPAGKPDKPMGPSPTDQAAGKPSQPTGLQSGCGPLGPSCTCKKGGKVLKGHIPCDKSKGACHCGAE